MSGLKLQQMLKKRHESLPIIFLTAHGDIDMAVGAMQEGAYSFLQKPIDNDKLLKCVAGAVSKDMKAAAQPFDEQFAKQRFDALSAREKEVFFKVAEGLINRDISLALDISERTVEAHRASIYKKLMVHSYAELMNFCACLGLPESK